MSEDLALDDEKVTLNDVVLEGTNKRGTIDVPFLGDVLQKARDVAPIAKDFTSRDFKDLYRRLKKGLKGYGRLFVTERKYMTNVETLEDDGEGELCDRCEERGTDLLKCGSYLKFQTQDATLEGTLWVGHEEDRNLVAENDGLGVEEKFDFAVKKLKRQGVALAGNLAGIRFLGRLPYGRLIQAGFGADGARRIYNEMKLDAHWTLELHPKEDKEVSKKQYQTYRAFVDSFGTRR